jgi:LysR family transcriptional regulator for metE and metH
VPPLLKRYRRAHPKVDVRIDATATHDPAAHLLGGRLDVAIVSDAVRDRRLVSRPIFGDEMVVIVDPRHPLAGKPFLTAADLATETLLMYSPKEESTIYRLLADEGVVPANVHVVQLTEAITELVKAGLGCSFLARWAVEPQLRTGALRGIPYTRRGYRRTWSAATLKDMARVPYVCEFVDMLADHPPFQRNGKSGQTKSRIDS